MKDEQLIAVLAAILAVGKKESPEDFLQEAINLSVAAGRAVADSKRTTRLKIDFEVATGVTRAG
jgi:hypothetical protein